MARRISSAEAKAHLPSLVAEVAHARERYIIERHGKPAAALVSVNDLDKLEEDQAGSKRPLGVLAMVGAWREVEPEELDSLVEEIYAERERDTGRSVEIDG